MLLFLKRRWKSAVFLVYTVVLSAAIGRHEPWFDEAQAWLLARDTSLYDLLFKYMRYEGSPGLWHLLLVLPAKLHLPYLSLNILAGVISAAGVYVFLKHSPFPWYIKILYPFSFFTLYQYAVVARSYALLPLLLFLTAAIYRDKINRPYLYIIYICLLANVSMHGFVIALGLVFIHIIDLTKVWVQLTGYVRRKHVASLAMFCIMVFLLVLQLKPAPDLISYAAFKFDHINFFPRSLTMFSDALITNMSTSTSYNKFFITASVFSKFIIVLTLFWLILNKKFLTFITPLTGLCFLFTIIYANVWHQGTVFFLWLFALWLSFDGKEDNHRGLKISKTLIAVCIAAVLCVQAYWSFNSFYYDFNHNYSASRDAANYIKENGLQDKRIYMTSFHNISILPYFSENIFCNYNNRQKPSFWLWSSKNTIYTEPYLSLKGYDPDYIMLGIKEYPGNRDPNDVKAPEIAGYRVIKIFKGCLYWKERPYETDSFALYERVGK